MSGALITTVRYSVVPAIRGCLLIAGLTVASYRLHFNSAAAGFLFLIAIALNCLDSGMVPATIASLMAVGCLDFFFVQPLFTFTVADPVDVAALAAFLTTSLVVTRLASKARKEARTAESERAHLARLYELAQKLLALDPLRADSVRLLDVLRAVFGLRAASLFDADSTDVHVSGESRTNLSALTRDAHIMGRDINDSNTQVAVRCIRAFGKPTCTLGLEGLEHQTVMAGPVVALVAAALERARAIRSASDAAAEARTETLRAAILDALAHEFKTPLATILTAAGGLHAAGALTPEQCELADLVESEATRLSDLSSRLLRLVRLDSQEVKPRLRPVNIQAGLDSLVDRYGHQHPDRQVTLVRKGDPAEILADAELLELAVSQLLDNACRYSPPDSQVQVILEFALGMIIVIVWNSGPSIPRDESRHIFERFYRGADGRRLASGTGLGLYVARKIALAHSGHLDLDGSHSQTGVAFRLTIPTSGEEFDFDEPASASIDRG